MIDYNYSIFISSFDLTETFFQTRIFDVYIYIYIYIYKYNNITRSVFVDMVWADINACELMNRIKSLHHPDTVNPVVVTLTSGNLSKLITRAFVTYLA